MGMTRRHSRDAMVFATTTIVSFVRWEVLLLLLAIWRSSSSVNVSRVLKLRLVTKGSLKRLGILNNVLDNLEVASLG
jgi:hypothetical protein